MDVDVEPALEALDFATNDSDNHRLSLVCLTVEQDEDKDEVESKKRRIKRNVKKRRFGSSIASSSPLVMSETDSVAEEATEPSEPAATSITNVPTYPQEKPGCSDEKPVKDYQPMSTEPKPSFYDIFWQNDATSNQDSPSQKTVEDVVVESNTLGFDFARDITLGNNAKARILIDIFTENGPEEISQVFMCFKGGLLGVHHRPPLIFVLVTSKAIYLMNHVHESQLFTLDAKIYLHELRQVVIDTSQPGLTIAGDRSSEKFEVSCASHDLMQRVIQAVISACRNSGNIPPAVVSDSSNISVIVKSLAKYLNVNGQEIKVKHTVAVFCGRSIDDSVNFDSFLESTELIENFDEGTFGLKEGMLMYQLTIQERNSRTTWKPGYFVLADGYLYCYTDASKSHLRFFGQLFNNHCKGCRRVTDDDTRPHVIELRLLVDNVVQFLYLATSNEGETTDWMINLLTSVNLDSPENIGHFDGKNCLEKFCLLVLTEDALFTLVRDVKTTSYQVLDHVNICDVMATVRSTDNPYTSFTFLVVEFESSQTSNSREWTLYFGTKNECDTFFQSLSKTWEELFQVPLQCMILDDSTNGVDENCEASIASQTLLRLSSWHRNAASVLTE